MELGCKGMKKGIVAKFDLIVEGSKLNISGDSEVAVTLRST